MRSGDLNRRVTIKAPPAAQDALGQPSGAWTTVATVWANIAFLSGSQTIRAGADTSSAKASIRIRYRTNVAAGMRVELGATVFNITAVLPDAGRKEYVDLVAEAIQ